MRLDERHELAVQELHNGRQDELERDERHIDRNEVNRFVEVGRAEVARVHFLAIDHARVIAQRLVELPVADIDRIHLRRTVSQHDVGEASGRRTDVHAGLVAHVDFEPLESMGELHPASSYPGMLQGFDPEHVVLADGRAGFVDVLFIDEDPPRHDQRLCLRARVDETALDQSDVEALLLHFAGWLKPSRAWPATLTWPGASRKRIPRWARCSCLRSS